MYVYFQHFPRTEPCRKTIGENLNTLIATRHLQEKTRCDRMIDLILQYVPLGEQLAKGASLTRYVPAWQKTARYERLTNELRTYNTLFPHAVGGDDVRKNIVLLERVMYHPVHMDVEDMRILLFAQHEHRHGRGAFVHIDTSDA